MTRFRHAFATVYNLIAGAGQPPVHERDPKATPESSPESPGGAAQSARCPRRPVEFYVGPHRVVATATTLTPGDILRAVGYPALSDPFADRVLVRMGRVLASEVYGPPHEDASVGVYDGTNFAVWPADDDRLHWYTLNNVRHVSLQCALSPAVILTRAGLDADAFTLLVSPDGVARCPLVRSDVPVVVNGIAFTTESNPTSNTPR